MPRKFTTASKPSAFARQSLLLALSLVSLPLPEFTASRNAQAIAHHFPRARSLPPPSQQTTAAQNAQDVTVLEPGKPIERELARGQSHTYQITLTEGQYLNVIVEQRGIDVVVRLLGPDSKLIMEFDSESRTQGQETVEQVADVTGSYRLNVQAKQQGSPAGRYEIRVTEMRAATEKDRALQEIRKLGTESTKLYRAGKYDEAVPLVERALEIREKMLGPEHSDVAAALNNLAILYKTKGDYVKAESLHQRALAIREKTLGPEHPDVAASLDGLANIYHSKGDYVKAEALYQRSLAIREKTLGPEHLAVSQSLNNLAILFHGKGDFTMAEQLYQRALSIKEKALGSEHPDVVRSLNNLAVLYKDKGDYARAEQLYHRVLTIREKVLGPNHPEVAISLNTLANLYHDKGDYVRAEPLYQRALAIREKALGPEHPGVASSLNGLSNLYRDKGEYAKAEPLYQRALAIREKVLGLEHIEVAASLHDLANLYHNKGEYAKAEPLHQRALAISEKALGPEHPDVAYSLNNLARLYHAKGEYAKAEPLYKRALVIWEKAQGPEHRNVATSLNNLAILYKDKGDYAKAELQYRRSLAISEKALGSEHLYVADSLNNLAALYKGNADYARAEPLYQRALTIREKALGPEHPEVAGSLNNLANLYQEKGDYAKAEPLHQRALAIREKVLGPEHPDVANTLNNLAILYKDRGDYARAEPLYQRALAIREKALGPEHPEVAGSLNNLAALYQEKGDYAKAEPLHQRALAIREKVLGPEHPDVADTLHNLALLYHYKGDYVKAEPLHQRALIIYEKALGPEHPDVATSLNNLARLYAAKGDLTQAVMFQSRASAVSERNIAFNLAAGSERQKIAYLATLSWQADRTISLHVHSAPTDPTARDLATTTILQRKGRVLDAMSDSLAAPRRSFNAQDQALLDQLKEANSQLAKLVLDGPQRITPAEHQKTIKALEEHKEKLEDEISRRSTEFRAQSQPITLAAAQAAIPVNAALIEFAAYRPFNAKAASDDKAYGALHYVAYIVRRQGEIQWKELGEAKTIDAAIDAWRKSLRDKDRQDVKELARAVEEKVFRPVRVLLGETTQLLISPDGALNLIPFAALVDEQGRYLVERYSFTYLTSGRDLLRLQVARESQSKPLIVADPEFGEPGLTQLAKADAPWPSARARKRQSVTTGTDLSSVFFDRLPRTSQEAKVIRSRFPNATVLTGNQATEASLKQAAAPLLLHVATHGFFLEDQPVKIEGARGLQGDGDVRALSASLKIENPLLRSGLALAGANLRKSGDDDGILTAMEAAGLNLWGTKLVVLSACDTGVGEVKTGEGVYGLRRALVLAGAETQVMSLWPVSDYVTRELMTAYYTGLKQGVGRGEALRQVQLKMLKQRDRQHPFFWASFIQSGEWANLDGKR